MLVPVAVGVLAVAAATLLAAGVRLTRSAERIAAASRYGRGWVGFLLLAGVTSLPEAVTGLSAITLYDLPNIAVGDIVGSLQLNLLLLAIAALAFRPALPRDIAWHRTSAVALAFVLAMVLAVFWAASTTSIVAGIGLATPLLLLAHPALARLQMRRQRARPLQPEPLPRGTWWQFAAAAAAVVAAGLVLPPAARELADATGLGRTVIGTLVVAATTSLPELVVTLAALRIGAVDLAVSDILGSNMFDLFLLGVYDLAYRGGPLLAAVDAAHGWTLAGALALHAAAWFALARRDRLMGPRAWTVVAVYAASQAALLARFT